MTEERLIVNQRSNSTLSDGDSIFRFLIKGGTVTRATVTLRAEDAAVARARIHALIPGADLSDKEVQIPGQQALTRPTESTEQDVIRAQKWHSATYCTSNGIRVMPHNTLPVRWRWPQAGIGRYSAAVVACYKYSPPMSKARPDTPLLHTC